MADNIIIIPNDAAINVGESIVEFCLPQRVPCLPTPKDGILSEEPWNCLSPFPCILDARYNNPYERGDKFQFQTLVFGGTASAPAGYDSLVTSVEVCLSDGTFIPAPFTRKMSAWKDGRPYQIIEIDTTNLTGCWNLKFTMSDSAVPCYSQHFGETYCDKSRYITIRSIVEFQDCSNYCYGTSDSFTGDEIEYDNTLRIRGNIRCTGFSIPKAENEITGEEYVDDSVRETFRVSLFGAFPPYMKTIFSKSLLYGKSVIIDGEEYLTGSVDVGNDLSEDTTMWRSSFDVYRLCFGNTNEGKYCL